MDGRTIPCDRSVTEQDKAVARWQNGENHGVIGEKRIIKYCGADKYNSNYVM